MSTNIRIFFEKKGRAKYISHLDIMRCFTRVIRRTDIPVWYTEGYNPRLYMMFPLPLPLGFEGERETFDIRLIDDSYPYEKILTELNRVFPEGIKALSAEPVIDELTTIDKAIYTITLKHSDIKALKTNMEEFMTLSDITVEKKSKRGIKTVNLAPDVKVQDIKANGDYLVIRTLMAAGINYNINPNLWLNAFMSKYGYEDIVINITRNSILRSDLSEWH